MTPHDYVRVAALAGCSVTTVTSFVKGSRKSHLATGRAIEAALKKLGLSEAVEAVRSTPVGVAK